MNWWVHDLYAAGQYTELISWIFWVLLSITLHELAHGWAAIWQGDNTPIVHQRMTLNPVTHMGSWSLIMFALVGIAWGVMPIDPSKFRWKRRGRIVVAGAGPAMNVLIAIVVLTAAAAWGVWGPQSNAKLFDNVLTFLVTGGWLNIFLALFNLLPIPPLDGSDVLSGISFTFYRWFQNPQVQQVGFFIMLAIFMSGIAWILQAAANSVAVHYVSFLVGLFRPGTP